MKQLIMSLAALAMVIGLCVPAEAAKDKSGVLKASSLIGKKIESTDGKKLGDIKDLVIDPETGNIQYAVLDFGGFLGFRDKYFAVPWDALELTADHTVRLDVSKKDLKQAPGFDKNNWPDLGSREQIVIIYEFYAVPLPEDMEKPKGQ
jgi:sporulation protein YlmC with PRC-barrel domain